MSDKHTQKREDLYLKLKKFICFIDNWLENEQDDSFSPVRKGTDRYRFCYSLKDVFTNGPWILNKQNGQVDEKDIDDNH